MLQLKNAKIFCVLVLSHCLQLLANLPNSLLCFPIFWDQDISDVVGDNVFFLCKKQLYTSHLRIHYVILTMLCHYVRQYCLSQLKEFEEIMPWKKFHENYWSKCALRTILFVIYLDSQTMTLKAILSIYASLTHSIVHALATKWSCILSNGNFEPSKVY